MNKCPPPPFFSPRHQERKSKTVLSFSSNAVLGTPRVKRRNQTSLKELLFPSPQLSALGMSLWLLYLCVVGPVT